MSTAAQFCDPALRLYEEARALIDEDRDEEASHKLDAAIAARPHFAEAFSLGGYLLERGGKPEAAERFYGRAVALNPASAATWANLAKLYTRFRRYGEALAASDRRLALGRGDGDVYNTRSALMRGLGRIADAADAAETALRLQPDLAEAAVNLGTARLKSDEPEKALAAYSRALEIRPEYADAICGRGLALRALNRLEEARAAFDEAARLGCREAVSGRGCLDLMLGDFERGWEGYEARWVEGKSIAAALGCRYRLWKGRSDPARRVLVINDHGLGDTIQFARYLPLMREAGVEAHFLCPAKMHRLIGETVEGRVFEREPDGVPFDAQIAISSLPRAFGTRLRTIPARTPYLTAEKERVARWAGEIGPFGLRVGCVWQGNPHPEVDVARSFPLNELAPLAAVEGVRLVSLQRGVGEEQISTSQVPIQRLAADFDAGPDALVDAAAAMMSLDLVVTCDTSIAHLAGALGRPVWVALKFDSEWRWLRGRDDSPWYPTMRLFRQTAPRDWAGVFARMSEALRALQTSA